MVLAALAARVDRPVGVDELADVLWGEQLPADPSGSIHALVSRLRKDLGTGANALVTTSGYALDASEVRVDAAEFEREAARFTAEPSPMAMEERAEGLRRALGMWRGHPWSELPDDLVAVAWAARAIAARRSALEALALLTLNEMGDPGDIGLLEEAVAEFPFSEPLARSLAVGRSRAGRRVEAIRGLGAFISSVRTETGLEPGPAVMRLEQLLVSGAPPGAGRDSEPGVPAPIIRHERDLVGRDGDLESLRGELRENRLVTVVGPGGVGKTAVAQALVEATRDRYRDGVYQCELASVRSVDALPFVVASVLKLTPRTGVPLRTQLVEVLAGRSALLVLDNCEHLLAAVASLVAEIATPSAALTVLATSREPLGLGFERRFELPPLEVALTTGSAPSQVPPAVDLFLRRARDAGVQNPAKWTREAEQICLALGGLPLAIELAASRCRSMSIPELADALESGLGALRDRRGTRAERHRDLESVITSSYETLTSNARALFAAVSVFAGGFDRNAASWIAEQQRTAEDIDDALDELIDKSLLEVNRDGNRARFRILEPIRNFGRLVLEASDSERDIDDAHLAYCTSTAREIAQQVGGETERLGVELAERELPNLRLAHRHAVASQQTAAAMQLSADLHDYAIWRENYEIGQWAREALGLPGATGHPLAPVVHATAGWAHNKAGRYDDAVRHAELGLEAESRGAEPTGWCHDVLVHTAYWTGEHQTAVTWAERELERARAAQDPKRIAYMLGDLAAHSAQSDPTEADRRVTENRLAVDLAEAAGVPSVLSFALHALGATLRLIDEAEAEAKLLRSLDLAESVDCRFVLTAAANHLGAIHAARGEWRFAIAILQPTLERFAHGADPAHVGMVARLLAAPLAALVPDGEIPPVIRIAGYGEATPGPRTLDVDARNKDLITTWRNHHGSRAVTRLLQEGATIDALATVDELISLAQIARAG